VSSIGLFIRERCVEPFLISEQRMGFMELRTKASMLLGLMRLFSLNRSLRRPLRSLGIASCGMIDRFIVGWEQGVVVLACI
jgi:hypothetical protein